MLMILKNSCIYHAFISSIEDDELQNYINHRKNYRLLEFITTNVIHHMFID